MLPFKDDNWFINDPEVARLLQEFEIFLTVDEEGVLEYYDSSASVAKQFLNEVKIFLGGMDDLCNPFLDESFDLYSLDTEVVVEQNVTQKKKLYGPFLWMGFNCLKARATSRRQFNFYH